MKYVVTAVTFLLLSCQAALAEDKSLEEIEVQPHGEILWKERPSPTPHANIEDASEEVVRHAKETETDTAGESVSTELSEQEQTRREWIAEKRDKLYDVLDKYWNEVFGDSDGDSVVDEDEEEESEVAVKQ